MADISEQKIVQSCIDGDRQAQRKLFELLAPKMLSVCLRYVGDRSVAEDLLQDAFVTLYTKLDSYKGEGSFEGWARRIFVTTCLMYLRKKDALKMSEELESAIGVSASTPSAMENIGYKELMALILQLPPGFRSVFNMYVIEGYSHKEISQALGISEVTSRTQLSRARLWLQEKMKDK